MVLIFLGLFWSILPELLASGVAKSVAYIPLVVSSTVCAPGYAKGAAIYGERCRSKTPEKYEPQPEHWLECLGPVQDGWAKRKKKGGGSSNRPCSCLDGGLTGSLDCHYNHTKCLSSRCLQGMGQACRNWKHSGGAGPAAPICSCNFTKTGGIPKGCDAFLFEVSQSCTTGGASFLLSTFPSTSQPVLRDANTSSCFWTDYMYRSARDKLHCARRPEHFPASNAVDNAFCTAPDLRSDLLWRGLHQLERRVRLVQR